MALPTSGPMSASAIRTEYRGLANVPISINDYHKATENAFIAGTPLYVPDVLANTNIPYANEIKFSNFRGGDLFGINVHVVDIIPETNSRYGVNNNGQVKLRLTGSPFSFFVQCDNGFKGNFTRGAIIPITGLNGSSARGAYSTFYPHALTITEDLFNYTYTLYLQPGGGYSVEYEWGDHGNSTVEGPQAVKFNNVVYGKNSIIQLPKP